MYSTKYVRIFEIWYPTRGYPYLKTNNFVNMTHIELCIGIPINWQLPFKNLTNYLMQLNKHNIF